MAKLTVREYIRYFNRDGGVPYRPGTSSLGEPSLLLLLAFLASDTDENLFKPLLSWVLNLKNPDGSFSMNAELRTEGFWLTPHFAIAMHHLGRRDLRDEAINFILSYKSITFESVDLVDLDPRLVGWPWAPGTFSWVEPTSWALLALRLAGQEDHPRAQEGRKLLKNRCIPSGGWNCGNKLVYSSELIPFWDTTALALLALDEKDENFLGPNIEFLDRGRDDMKSLYSLSLGCLCLEKFGKNVDQLREKIDKLLDDESDSLNLAHSALGLIALAKKRVLTK